jgi:competence ComEA-like helix-hairpin-helix protein
MTISISTLARRLAPAIALAALLFAMGGTWITSRDATAAPPGTQPVTRPATATTATSAVARDDDERAGPGARVRKEVSGKLNLNTATEEQLMLLPTVGPSKAERIVVWRKKNGGFKRTADLRRVKGFGYRTFKRLEPFLDIKGDTPTFST